MVARRHNAARTLLHFECCPILLVDAVVTELIAVSSRVKFELVVCLGRVKLQLCSLEAESCSWSKEEAHHCECILHSSSMCCLPVNSSHSGHGSSLTVLSKLRLRSGPSNPASFPSEQGSHGPHHPRLFLPSRLRSPKTRNGSDVIPQRASFLAKCRRNGSDGFLCNELGLCERGEQSLIGELQSRTLQITPVPT